MPRGKKQCPKCQVLVGPRTYTCACGHVFIVKGQAPAKAPAAAAAKALVARMAPPRRTPTVAEDAADAVRAAAGKRKKGGGIGPQPATQIQPWQPPLPPRRGKKGAPPRIEKPFEGLSESPATVIGITDREALDSFLKQLQDCRSHSDLSGGCYSAFLHHRHGTLRVEVWLTMQPKGEK